MLTFCKIFYNFIIFLENIIKFSFKLISDTISGSILVILHENRMKMKWKLNTWKNYQFSTKNINIKIV